MKATNKAKQKVWMEVWSMPDHILPEDKLLIREHQFIKSELWDKIRKGDTNNATDGHRSV